MQVIYSAMLQAQSYTCDPILQVQFFFFFFFFFIDKTHITVTKFKTKRKYITILQIGSKLHKDEKE